MKKSIKERIKELESELISLRRDFHQHPELGYKEFRTSKVISEYLENLGIETHIQNGTGVVALLKGDKKGKTIMLRADMDALEQNQSNDVEYSSQNPGVMHACAHDAHMAILLITAKILSELKSNLCGQVKFVFQPNEEAAGALDMINEGVLENPKVDCALGLHVWSQLPSGSVGIKSGPVMGAMDEFSITIKGYEGHTSAPHEAIDPISISGAVIQNIQHLVTREYNPLTPLSIVFGSIHGGLASNAIAGSVVLSGTIRYLFKEEKIMRLELLKRFERTVTGVCEALGGSCEIKITPSNPAVLNDDELTYEIRNVAKSSNIFNEIVEYQCLAGEDFGEFTQKVASVFYFIGSGNKEKETDFPHHHPKFNIDEDVMKLGVEMQVSSAIYLLG